MPAHSSTHTARSCGYGQSGTRLVGTRAGDVVGLTPGEKLTCAPLTPERAVGAGLQQYQTCNPK